MRTDSHVDESLEDEKGPAGLVPGAAGSPASGPILGIGQTRLAGETSGRYVGGDEPPGLRERTIPEG